MGNSSDTLHLNGVHLLQGVIKDTWGIDSLESQVFVVKMAHKQTLGGESVWLNIHICASDAAEETRLSDVGVPADQKSTGVGINRRQTAQMLANLVKVHEGIFESLNDCSHTTKSSPFELLALEQRLRILDEAHVVSRDGLNQVLGCRQLTESDLEMVGIVQGVEEIFMERMDVLEAGETLEDGAKFLGEGLLGELDLSGVEG
jgi:hypothetical protein